MMFFQPSEVQFFGAITLHKKLMQSWSEIPENLRNELKENILQKIITFGSIPGTKLVLNRLCMSVSYSFL